MKERHNFNLLHVKWSNFWNTVYKFTKFSPMLERDLVMACTKFHKNWLIIDGEIDEKHALQIYQNKYVLDIERLAAILEIC